MTNWIHSNEQLPPLEEDVLCICGDGDYEVLYLTISFDDKYIWRDNVSDYTDYVVIAWTNLPSFPCEDMRDATEEERKSTKDYINSISKPTGLRFDDLYEEINFVQSHNKIPCTITIGKPSEDCISREEAIKKLKALSWTNYDLDDAAEVLKRLPSVQPKTRWIPCSERLPDDDEDYLVIDDIGECGVGYYRHTANAWDSTNFGWLEGINRMDDYLDMPCGLSKVVAWMPLPLPYKAESEE